MAGLTPSEVIKTLRTGVDDGRKISVARSAWQDDRLALPRKVDVLLDFVLDRLLKGRQETGPHAPLFSLAYWSLLHDLVQASPASLPPLLARIPTLPVLNSIFAADAARNEASREVLSVITSAYRVVLPLACHRATVENILECSNAAFDAIGRTPGYIENSSADLVSLFLAHAESALAAAGPAGRKKAFQPFLEHGLPALIAFLAQPQQHPAHRQQMLLAARQALFSQATLSKSTAPTELLAALPALLAADPTAVQALPSLLTSYIAALRKHAPAIFPPPPRANVPMAEQQSRSALEVHHLSKIRSAVFTFFDALLDLLRKDQSITAALEQLLRVLVDEHMYSMGATPETIVILQKVAARLVPLVPSPSALRGLSLLLGMNFETIRPALSDLLDRLAHCERYDAAANELARDVLAYHGKTRQLPDYLVLLADRLSQPDTPLESPLTRLSTLRREIRLSLGPAQVVGTLEALFKRIEETPASEPPRKKRRKENEGTFRAPQRGLAAAFIASTALDAVVIAKPDRAAVVTLLKGVATSEVVRGSMAKLAEAEVDEQTIATLMLVRSIRARAADLGDTELAVSMDEALEGMLKLAKRVDDVEPAVTLEMMRLAFSLLDEVDATPAHTVCDAALDIMARPGQPWSGQIFTLTLDELPTALWHLVASLIGVFERQASAEQLVRFASLLLQDFDAPHSPTPSLQTISRAETLHRLLASAQFFELPRLRAAFLPVILARAQSSSTTAANLATMYSRLAVMPMQYFPLDTRRKFLRSAIDADLRTDGSTAALRSFALAATISDDGSITAFRDLRFLQHLARSDDGSALTKELFIAAYDLCRHLWKGEPEQAAPLPGFITSLGSTSSSRLLSVALDRSSAVLQMSGLSTATQATLRKAIRDVTASRLEACTAIRCDSSENLLAAAPAMEATRAGWAALLWSGVEDLDVHSRLAQWSSSRLAETLQLLERSSVPLDTTGLIALLELVALRMRITGTDEAAEAFLAVYFTFAGSCTESESLDRILAQTLLHSSATWLTCFGLLERQLLSGSGHEERATRAVKTISLLLENRPQGLGDATRAATSRLLRLLTSLIAAEQPSPLHSAALDLLCLLCRGQLAALLERSDAGCLLAALACIHRADATTTARLATASTSLVRRRTDLVSSLMPSFARLTAQLLATSPDESVGRLLASLGDERSLAGALRKHAPFVLLPWLRAGGPGREVLGAKTNGLAALLGAMSPMEREALMSGLLGKEEEAERALLRSVWREYDRARYKGGA